MRRMARFGLAGAAVVVVLAGALFAVAMRGGFGQSATIMVLDFTAPLADVLAYVPGRVRPSRAAAPAEAGVFYRHSLSTHCGVEYAWFDGRWWQASPKLYRPDGMRANPPVGWGNPFTPGKIGVIGDDRAMFIADTGERATFAVRSTEPSDGCA